MPTMPSVKVTELEGGKGTQEVIAAGLGSTSFSSFESSVALIYERLLGSQGVERETRYEKRETSDLKLHYSRY